MSWAYQTQMLGGPQDDKIYNLGCAELEITSPWTVPVLIHASDIIPLAPYTSLIGSYGRFLSLWLASAAATCLAAASAAATFASASLDKALAFRSLIAVRTRAEIIVSSTVMPAAASRSRTSFMNNSWRKSPIFFQVWLSCNCLCVIFFASSKVISKNIPYILSSRPVSSCAFDFTLLLDAILSQGCKL
ncbi:hypothetical protein GQ44DRAFT_708652, partial [Phaeosphaeriaceae sp. PMI808]